LSRSELAANFGAHFLSTLARAMHAYPISYALSF